ncbi:putative QWRF family protein [Lupinus albus]|uniref:Putative QWRF family protein n=1 Tax=Lupinus albus TaxID=3870 RepID=A0A6A4NW56_LUPAL|nr:putative QWRF family protein [Lupinus albus]
MVQVCDTMIQQHITVSQNPISDTTDSVPPPPLPPTPSHNRRPRVREVSSRFMSPSVSTVQRRRHQQLEADENNRPIENSETPFTNGNSNSHCKPNLGPTSNMNRMKQRSVKLFKESNGIGRVEHVPPPHPSKSCSSRIGIGVNNVFATPSSRPDTPTFNVSSRYRINQQHRTSANINGNASAAAKLLQASGMSNNHQLKLSAIIISGLSQVETNSDTGSVYSDDECHDSDVSCSIQSLPELCSQGDLLPTVSTRSVVEKIGYRSGLSSSGDLKFRTPLSRSISFPTSSGSEHLVVNSVKGSEKQQACSLSKQCGNQTNHVKAGGLSLPPVHPCAKQVNDTRKGRKGSSHLDDVHSMRLLYNRHLQWRFANAKAAATMKSQQRGSEKALYSLVMKLSELRDSVNMKCIELGLLQSLQTVSKILEAQIPYLDEWSALEEDYSVSITDTIQGLMNALVQLPTGGNVRVDVGEMEEALNSALKMMESIFFHIQRFMPKAEETDTSISELARVAGGEKAIVGECGDLLSKAHKSQMEECTLRSQLIQLHSVCHKNTEQVTDNSIASPHK